MIAPSLTDQPAKRDLLRGLSDALSTLAQRLQTQETIKRMIFLLAARAETIAAQAWDLNAKKGRDVERAAMELVDQLVGFSKSFTELAERVAEDIASGQSIAAAMVVQANAWLKLGRAADAAGGMSDTLLQLRPLAASLTTLATHQQNDMLVANDSATLADRATKLAERAQTMTTPAGMRVAGRTGMDLHYALRSIADDAAAVSLRLMTEATLLKAAVVDMADGTRKLAVASAAKGKTAQDEITADRIRQVVRKGQSTGR